jgi:hypothetical protein
VHGLPHYAGVHTCHTAGFSYGAADMAQRLVQPTTPAHKIHVPVKVTLGGLGKVTGLSSRHLLQLPSSLFHLGTYIACAATLYRKTWHFCKLMKSQCPKRSSWTVL